MDDENYQLAKLQQVIVESIPGISTLCAQAISTNDEDKINRFCSIYYEIGAFYYKSLVHHKDLLEVIFSLFKVKELEERSLYEISKIWKIVANSICTSEDDARDKYISEFSEFFHQIMIECIQKAKFTQDDFRNLNIKNEEDAEFDPLFR